MNSITPQPPCDTYALAQRRYAGEEQGAANVAAVDHHAGPEDAELHELP